MLKFVKLLKVKSKSWFQIVEDVPVLLLKIQKQTWKILKFVKLLNIESKSWFQIVEDIPVLLLKIQTQTWKILKFVLKAFKS